MLFNSTCAVLCCAVLMIAVTVVLQALLSLWQAGEHRQAAEVLIPCIMRSSSGADRPGSGRGSHMCPALCPPTPPPHSRGVEDRVQKKTLGHYLGVGHYLNGNRHAT